MKSLKLLAVFVVLALLSATCSAAVVVKYVKWDSPYNGPGNDWAHAYRTIQAGINACPSGGEVWVAGGSTHPYFGRITLKNGVGLYGGFAGTETVRGQRDWKTNVTILDGNQAVSIVTSPSGATPTTVIDGFTIRNGRSDFGGGVYCSNSSPAISNNTISGSGGTGIFCQSSSPMISNNTISGNISSGYGGGIYCGSSNPAILGNAVIGNSGDGIFCYLSSPVISNNTVSGNSGSGISCDSSSPMISNNTISGNSAGEGGGAYCFYNSSPAISNNIIALNSSGIYRDGTGDPTFKSNDVYNPDGYNYSGMADPTGNSGNISVDPKFANASYGKLHIQPDSPCIDAGDDSIVQPGWVDMDGQPRIQGAHVDIGADESDGTTWTFTPTVIRVRPTGNDSNDGSSWTLAKKTVQAGIDAASIDGGEAWVAAGTYNERITLKNYAYLYGGFAGTESQKNQRKWKANVTILDGQRGGSVVTCKGGYLLSGLDGFIVRNGRAPNGGGIDCSGSSPTLANNTISGNSAWIEGGGGIYCGWSSPEILNNTVTGNSASSGGGICCGSHSSPRVSNNSISGNSADRGGGIYCGWYSSPTISNNTISGNRVWLGGGGIYWEFSSPLISNNVICLNSSGIYVYGYIPGMRLPVFGHNDVYNPLSYNYSGFTDQTGINGNISTDPIFVDAANGDYHLQWNSPCIDAGTNEGAPGTDFDGIARPVDGDCDGVPTTDIGAFEYVPIHITIDVLPGQSPNHIVPQPNKLILVAILGSAGFDVSQVDPLSVVFGPGRATEVHAKGHLEDVNFDGFMDMVLHFRCGETGITPGTSTVHLYGRLTNGERIEGSDSVTASAK